VKKKPWWKINTKERFLKPWGKKWEKSGKEKVKSNFHQTKMENYRKNCFKPQ